SWLSYELEVETSESDSDELELELTSTLSGSLTSDPTTSDSSTTNSINWVVVWTSDPTLDSSRDECSPWEAIYVRFLGLFTSRVSSKKQLGQQFALSSGRK